MILHALKRQFVVGITRTQIPYFCKMNYSSEGNFEKYKTLKITMPQQFIHMVQLNRPSKKNAMNGTMWKEFKICFNELAVDPECRVIILSGTDQIFCAGIDFQDLLNLAPVLAEQEDIARKCKILKTSIKECQDSFNAIEKCPKPVIAAVDGPCVGAGVDMISAADIRYCSSTAWFQIKETDIGMAADVGTLQRFPKIISSDSLVKELVYTARKFTASEALQCGFISRVFENHESLLEGSIELAKIIASKSPVAVQSSKLSLVYSRDHSVQEGLDHIALLNQSMLQSEDFTNATMAQALKSEPPVFSKL